MATDRPKYRNNPPYTIGRKGRKTFDDVTQMPCYEKDIVVQRGLRKDARNRFGSVNRDFGGGLYGYPLR